MEKSESIPGGQTDADTRVDASVTADAGGTADAGAFADAGPQPDAGLQPDEGEQLKQEEERTSGSRRKNPWASLTEDEDEGGLGTPRAKPRITRQKRSEGLMLTGIDAKFVGVIRDFQERIEVIENALGSMSREVTEIDNKLSAQHNQLNTTMSNEQAMLRDYIKNALQLHTTHLETLVRNEVAGEAGTISDRITEAMAKHDAEKQQEHEAEQKKLLDQITDTYRMAQHTSGAVTGLKDDLALRLRELSTFVRTEAADKERQVNALSSQVTEFEADMSKFIRSEFKIIKPQIKQLASMQGEITRGCVDAIRDEIAKQCVDAVRGEIAFQMKDVLAAIELARENADSSTRKTTADTPAGRGNEHAPPARRNVWFGGDDSGDERPVSPSLQPRGEVQSLARVGQARDAPPHMPEQPTRGTDATRKEAAATTSYLPQNAWQLMAQSAAPAQSKMERIKFKDATHFSGKIDENIDIWITTVSNELKYGGRTDEEIEQGLPMLLEGEAKRWFNRLTDEQRGRVKGWAVPGGWQDALRDEFRPANYLSTSRSKLNQTIWSEELTFSEYFEKRSELQMICMPGKTDADLIEDMLAGMNAADQAEARKQAKNNMSLLQWKRAVIEIEPTIRARLELSIKMKELDKKFAAMSKASQSQSQRRSSAWSRPNRRPQSAAVASDVTPQQGPRGGGGTSTVPGTEKTFGAQQRAQGNRYNQQSSSKQGAEPANQQQRTVRAQVASVQDDESEGNEEQFQEENLNDDFDSEAEADFLECLSAQVYAVEQGPRRSTRAAARTEQAARAAPARNSRAVREQAVPNAEEQEQTRIAHEAGQANEQEPVVEAASEDEAMKLSDMRFEDKSPAYVQAKFKEQDREGSFKVCTDTGSSITLIDKALLDKYFQNVTIRPERLVNVKGVGGSTAMAKSATLHMSLTDSKAQEISLQVKFFVNPADEERIILGNDFMTAVKAQIDIGKQQMTIRRPDDGTRVEIPLSTSKLRTPLLRTTEAFTLKPFHRARVKVRLSGRIASSSFYIDPLPLEQGLVAVSTRRGIAETARREMRVEVYNLEPWPYKMERGTAIATAIPVEDCTVQEATALWSSEDRLGSVEDDDSDLKAFNDALKDLDINPNLSQEEREKVLDTLRKHRRAFAYGDRPLGHTNLGKVRIDTGTAPPVSTPPFRISPEGRKVIEKEVAKLLANDVIEEADSPWASNVVLIKQKDKIRFCVDYRKVNAVTRTDQYPLPRIDDYLNQFQGKRYFSTFDANSGFNQVEIEEQDREKTAFRTHIGLYQYKRMPFGLKNGPSVFQRCMDQALGPTKWEFALVYIDDIVIYSATFDEHIGHIEAILGRIIPTGFTLSLPKSHICYEEVHALGHTVSRLGIGMKGENVKSILNYPRPKNVKHVQIFLGMAGYYRRFIKGFASIARPLTSLLKKGVQFTWTEQCDAAFEELRRRLAEEPILAHPDYDREFIIYTDASLTGLGAILAQKDDENREHIVCAVSKTLEERETRLSATEMECLALVWALRQFHPYIDGVKTVKIVTDHSALQWIWDYKGNNAKLKRWSTELQVWRGIAKIIHRPGKSHANADALSRAPGESEAETLTVSAIQIDSAVLKDIKDGYITDQFFSGILESLNMCARRGIEATGTLRQFELHDGVIFKRNAERDGLAMCIPRYKSLRSNLLNDFHDAKTSAHMGWEKTLASIARLYYWPKIRKDVKAYVASCDKCQKNKYANRPPAGLLQPYAVVNERWHTVTMDFAGPFVKSPQGNDTVLLVVDKCTRRAHFAAAKQTDNAKATAQLFIVHIVRIHGLPRVILSDRDRKFTSNFWAAIMEKMGVKTAFSTANHPQTDGQSENAVKTLKTMLRQFINYRQDNWEELLPYLEIAYNNSVNASTGFTPFELDTGYHARMPHDMVNVTDRSGVKEVDDLLEMIREKTVQATQAIEEAQRRQASYHDDGRTEHRFQVDDMVLLSTKYINPPWAKKQKTRKLRPLWIGPYRVSDVVNVNSYGLELPADMKVHSTINVQYLKPYVASPEEWSGRTEYGLPVHSEDGIEFFEPEAILDDERRGRQKNIWYLVKWKGRAIEQASWRPATELEACAPKLINEYGRNEH